MVAEPERLFNVNSEHPSHKLAIAGVVGEVVSVACSLGTVSISGRPSPPLVVGELLGVSTPTSFILGEVIEVRATVSALEASLKLFASVDQETLEISQGVLVSPANGATVYRPRDAVVQAILEERQSVHQENTSAVKISLGASPLWPTLPLSFTPERILGRHCAIVGSSGSGKSWSLARILEECSRSGAKVIVIDPSGEYVSLADGVKHVALGATNGTALTSSVALPYYELTEADLIAILRPTSATQITKLRAAIRSLKLAQLSPNLCVDGAVPKAHRLKVPYEDAFADLRDEIGRPENLFNISRLALQVGLECVDPIRSQTESGYWGGMNTSDHSECVPLISTIEDLLQGDELDFIFKPSEGQTVFEAIRGFLSDPAASILRVSCDSLPTMNRVREIAANSLARFLLRLARQDQFRSMPLILAVDEAHQMLPSSSSKLSLEYPLEAFNIIAKEGRKYGLTLCLSTQRPRDIPDDVLSQVGTFIVHRLVSDGDRHAIERASGAVSQSFSQRLPLLTPGEAYLLGISFQTPLRLRVLRPYRPPVSNGPDFQSSWTRLERS